jgi:hypothetical protein
MLLVKERLLYISVDGLHSRFSGDQVIVTLNPLVSLHSLTDQEFSLSNRDRTRPYKTFLITITVFKAYELSKTLLCLSEAPHFL